MYETLLGYQKFVNKKLKTGKLPITITFLPMRSDQIEKALSEGLGDIVAYGVVVTPEREKNFAFSIPLMTDVKQVVVTRADAGSLHAGDLGGKEVYVNPLTTYYQNLQTANETLKNSGKAPMVIKAADKNLTDDDLLQMVRMPDSSRPPSRFSSVPIWSQVLPNLKSHANIIMDKKNCTAGPCARTTHS